MTQRINWTQKEIAKLAPRVIEQRATGLSIIAAVNRAQEVLPAKRQRLFDSMYKIRQNKWLVEALAATGINVMDAGAASPLTVEAAAVQVPIAAQAVTPRAVRTAHPKTHVLWNEEEEQNLIKGAVLELQAGAKSMLSAVRRAQIKVLPEGRQRKLATIGQVPKNVAQQAEVKFLTAPTLPAATVEPQTDITSPPSTPPQSAQDWLQELLALPGKLSAQIDALDKRLSSVEYTLMLVLETISDHTVPPPKIQEQDLLTERVDSLRKVAKRKVVIVGQKSIQFQEVEKKWGEHFYLNHISSASGDSFSLERLKHADYVIGVTNFINHSTQNRIRSVVPKGQYFFASTPVGDVCKVLETIFWQLDLLAAQQHAGNGVAVDH